MSKDPADWTVFWAECAVVVVLLTALVGMVIHSFVQWWRKGSG